MRELGNEAGDGISLKEAETKLTFKGSSEESKLELPKQNAG